MELISHKKETRESKCVQIGPYSLGIATWLLQRVPYKASLSTLGPVYAGPSILFLAAAIQQNTGEFSRVKKKKAGEMMKDAKSIKIKQ